MNLMMRKSEGRAREVVEPRAALPGRDVPEDLHPEYRAIVTSMAELGLASGDPTRMPLAQARRASERFYGHWNQDPPPIDAIFERTAASAIGDLRLRFYRHRTERKPPVLLYFHGGGFALNSIDTHDRLLRLLAIQSGAAICAVGYSRAPERRFPHQLHEAVAAVRWVAGAADDLDVDGDTIALAGDSAGANLALAAALALRDAGDRLVARLMLLYGMYAPDFATTSHRRYGGGEYGLSTERMRWFWRSYLGEDGGTPDPYAAPLIADLRGLPPTLVVAAGRDCLRDDSIRLAQRLGGAAVPHVLSCYPDAPHSFIQLSRGFSPAATAIEEVAAALRSLQPAPIRQDGGAP